MKDEGDLEFQSSITCSPYVSASGWFAFPNIMQTSRRNKPFFLTNKRLIKVFSQSSNTSNISAVCQLCFPWKQDFGFGFSNQANEALRINMSRWRTETPTVRLRCTNLGEWNVMIVLRSDVYSAMSGKVIVQRWE